MSGRAVRYLFHTWGGIVIPVVAVVVLLTMLTTMEQDHTISNVQQLTSDHTTITIQTELVNQKVESYSDVIQKYADAYSISNYSGLVKAIMMQESRGEGTDPMQASGSYYNEKYAGATIEDPDYSIKTGVQELSVAIAAAKVRRPDDVERISLAVQGYNFGIGYIYWAEENYGGYSEENAAIFANTKAYENGWDSYGDPDYVSHVLRYYSYSYAISGSSASYAISGSGAQSINEEGSVTEKS